MPEETEKVVEEVVVDKDAIITEFVKSQKFIDLLNAEKGKAVKNFQDEKMPTILDERVKATLEAKEHKEPWQIEMETVQRELATLKEEKALESKGKLKAENKNLALKSLSDKGLPTDIIDFFVTDDKDKTTERVSKFTDMMEAYTLNLKQGSIKGNNISVPSNDKTQTSGHGIPEPTSSNPKDWEAYYKKVSLANKQKQ